MRLREKGELYEKSDAKVAFDHNVGEDGRVKIKLDLAKTLFANVSYIHKINKNLKFTISDAFAPFGFFKGGDKERYRLGFAVEANF